MDVLEIDAASNTGVDSIRDLRENVRYAPAGSRYKIYIIDEVHRLSGAAFDALLKTLEEPPKHVIFIFATTEPHSLPATILSRTQRYDFRRIPLSDLIESLRKAARKEEIKITDDALTLIARKGDGSLRDALSLFEQVLAYADGEITVELISDALGLVDLSLLFELTECIHNHDSASVLEHASRLTQSGADISQFLIDLQTHLRNLLVAKSVEDPSNLIELSDLYVQKYDEQKGFFSESDIMRMVHAVADLRQQLKEGADPRIYLDMMLLKLARMDTTATLTEVLEKLQSMAGGGSGIPTSSMSSARSMTSSPSGSGSATENVVPSLLNSGDAVPSPGSVTNNSGKSIKDWDSFLENYTQTNGVLSVILKQGVSSSVDDGIIRLAFPPDAGARAILTTDKVRKVESAMADFFGRQVRLKIESDSNARPNNSRTTLDPRFDMTPQDLFDKNPDIKKIVDKYDAKITSIKKIDSKGAENG
jgi:DNA polymerase-3 subunit gamma/tau